MDAATLRDDIEDEYETELSRLGSSKALYAVTGGDMEAEAVLSALADRAAAAAATFEAWADDESNGRAVDAFAAAARTARGHAERVADADGAVEAREDPTPLEASLRGADGTADRAGGLLAWALVTDATLSQVVGFFVGSAERASADLFRELRDDIDDERERALDLLADACTDGADWERAEAAAGDAIEAAYEHYVETLEGMGITVKPIC